MGQETQTPLVSGLSVRTVHARTNDAARLRVSTLDSRFSGPAWQSRQRNTHYIVSLQSWSNMDTRWPSGYSSARVAWLHHFVRPWTVRTDRPYTKGPSKNN